ncbi:MAG TPA: ABC transporter substrate-binding protein [Trueperaceae bacterium]
MKSKQSVSYLVTLVVLLGALLVGSGALAQGGRVVLPIVDDPIFNQLHPNAYVESVMVNRVLFNGLVKLGKDFDTAPDLAESWEASDDGLTWTFHLRDDVVWHDGEPFTADDVIFTFEEVILNPEVGANNARIYANVEEVVAVDDHTVEFHLASPFASLGVNLAYNTPILPAHVLRGTDVMNNNDFNRQNPVGTGPFALAQYEPGQRVVLEPNDDYFLGAPVLDEVVYEIIPDPNSQLARLLAGELDVMIIDNPITTQRLRNNNALEITTSNQLNYYWAGPNLSRTPFDRKEFRQALSYAIDRKVMIENVLLGFASPATGPISPVLQTFYTDDVQTYDYDPERARELLEEAGFTFADDGTALLDGEPFSFTITYPNVQVFAQVGTLLQQYFRDIGIGTELQGLEFNSFVSEALVPRDFDMLLGWWVTPPDPDIFPYYHSSAAEGGNNATMYRSDEADALLQRGRETSDPQERVQIYHELQQLLAEDLPMIYLWYPDEIVAMDANLEGVPEAIGYRPALQYIHEWRME